MQEEEEALRVGKLAIDNAIKLTAYKHDLIAARGQVVARHHHMQDQAEEAKDRATEKMKGDKVSSHELEASTSEWQDTSL
mmetsp:Transcript_21731/g.35939  ORF Transcript_21731/g.35939 Transcript_21731/m.35939 type:complete len:80 (+) Transcript_21731:141-380(+)